MIVPERKQILIIAITVVMGGGFLLFRYLPLRKRMKEAEQLRNSQASIVTQQVIEGGQLPVLRKQLEDLKSIVGDYDSRVPMSGGTGDFQQRIAGLMDAHNLVDQKILLGKEIESEGINGVPVSVGCRGSLPQIFEFFGSLQSLDRLVRIEDVRLVNEKDFSGQVKMEVETVIYYRTNKS
jgi:Tfp pilus assembly protein PilO